MACAIVSGYILDCKNTVGGISNIYITELANVTAVGQNASGYVTGITKIGGTKFFKYALEPRVANSATNTIQATPANGTVSYAQSIVADFTKLQYATQAKLQLLIQNRTAIIVETKDGSFFYFGLVNGMEVSAGTAHSGANMNDKQGYSITFTGEEKALANEIDPSIIAALQS